MNTEVDIEERLEALARTPVLLVATDYDGTLAPIVEDPDLAHPDREAMIAVRNLAELPSTHVSIISGRALGDLARLSGAPEKVHLVGSHGSEFDVGFSAELDTEQRDVHQRMIAELKDVAAQHPGLSVEIKPAGVAFHYRNAPDDVADRACEQVLVGPATWDGVHVKSGKKVIELTVVETNKGDALEVLRKRLGATAALFLGDDRTDEDAFDRLSGPDVGVKVGEGITVAGFRVDDTREVSRLLARLSEMRERWLSDEGLVPIEEHSLISDQRTVGLITPNARLTWFCAPRIDSPAIFSELLGGPTSGYFSVADADGAPPLMQSYEGSSLVLRTSWRQFSVVDYLDCSVGRSNQRAGRVDLVRAIEGHGRVRIEFAPRLDYGRRSTRLELRPDGLVIDGSYDPILLRSPGVEWRLEEVGPHQTAVAEIELRGAPVILELRYGAGSLGPEVLDERERRNLTERMWSKWAGRLELPPVANELVLRSALTLKALVHGPSGGIAAAATTSLPEWIGGVRNWDYRFTWLRDAALSADALAQLGSLDEAMAYLDWVLGIIDHLSSPEQLRPLYTITGGDLSPEAEIGELSGYGGSRPVRIGNAASSQVQLDVFGPIVTLIYRLGAMGAPLSAEHWRLVESLVRAVEKRWDRPDHGIWEIRDEPRHHVYSKAMCWSTIDRACAIGREFFGRELPEWERLADRIKADVLENGFKEEVGAFTSAYDGVDLDAANLMVGLCGLIEPTDPRFVGTVEAIERELRDGPTVYRYRIDDGLPGTEGGFHILASWLVDALEAIGRREDAEALFWDLCALAGPTGLLSEQYDPGSQRALGNHPQAYSHLGLIHNALRLFGGRG